MNKNFFTEKFLVIVLLMLCSHNMLQAATGDSTSISKRFDVGLSVSSLIHLPYFSVDYKINDQLGLTLEAKPKVVLFETDLLEDLSFGSDLLELDFKTKGFYTNLQLRFLHPAERKWSFTPAIELSYVYKYLREEGVSDRHYDFYGHSRTSFNAIIFYGNKSFRFFLAFGLAYQREYMRGYEKNWVKDYSGYFNSWYQVVPIHKSFNDFDANARIGFRFSVIHW